jgi:hypothetical protein
MATGYGATLYATLADEVSRVVGYYDEIVWLEPLDFDSGMLFEKIQCRKKTAASQVSDLPDWSETRDHRGAILINANWNYSLDVQRDLAAILPRLNRFSRLIAVVYNPYLAWLYRLTSRIGVRTAPTPTTFFTLNDLQNLATISGYELVRERPAGLSPFRLFGLGDLLNRVGPAIPMLNWLCLAAVVTLRPKKGAARKPSLSIVIPARNEAGNIEPSLQRLPPDLAPDLEVIFVEGNSTDETWAEILRVKDAYRDRFRILALQQTGKGKCDAVRVGFAHASGDVLTILDADLTMPPELLSRFYSAYTEGLADFVNGSRLIYPMEGEAMRPLNWLGNAFFAKALRFVLQQSITDSLCGTKLLARSDYERVVRWRKDFGDFDPFGDFELLFAAAHFSFGIVDIPIRYRARTYGQTNIHRFRDGWLLLKMVWAGFWRIRVGSRPWGDRE